MNRLIKSLCLLLSITFSTSAFSGNSHPKQKKKIKCSECSSKKDDNPFQIEIFSHLSPREDTFYLIIIESLSDSFILNFSNLRLVSFEFYAYLRGIFNRPPTRNLFQIPWSYHRRLDLFLPSPNIEIREIIVRTNEIMMLPDSTRIIELDRFHANLIHNGFFNINPRPNSSLQRLTNVVIELLIWEEMAGAIQEHIWSHLWGDLKLFIYGENGEFETKEMILSKVRDILGDRIRFSIKDDIRMRWDFFQTLLKNMRPIFWTMQYGERPLFTNMIKAAVNEQLNDFLFVKAYIDKHINSELKDAIHYTFMLYQMYVTTLHHTERMTLLQEDILHTLIETGITEKEAAYILSMIWPLSTENQLDATQLSFINRFL